MSQLYKVALALVLLHAIPTLAASVPAGSSRGLCEGHQDVAREIEYNLPRTSKLSGAAEIVIDPSGKIKSVRIIKTTDPQTNRMVTESFMRLRCRGQGLDVTTYYPFEVGNAY